MRIPALRRAKPATGRRRRPRRLPAPLVGLLAAVIGVGALVASFQKLHILADLQSGRVVTAVFAQDYDNLIRPDWTKVDLASVAVGVVTNLRVTRRGHAIVSMKVDPRALQALGTQPTAAVELVTMLGGNVFIQLHPGGRPGTFAGTIPPSRTTTPVYLGRVLNAFTPQARRGVATAVTQIDGALANGGVPAAQSLVAAAPGALAPAAGALGALEGTQPGDLTTLVRYLDSTATSLAGDNGQLRAILHSAGAVSQTVASQAGALGTTVAQLPATLASAQRGLADLQAVLAHLRQLSGPLTPSAAPLDQLFARAYPTLAAAVPLVRQLPAVLAQAAPLLTQLAPTTSSATSLLNDIRGPVIDRVLNPIIPALLRRHGGSSTPMYQEVGYMLSGLDGIAEMTDANGAMIDFNPGVNLETAGGLPFTGPLSYHNHPKG
jgi:phospholipid/cholesterol/gamma-HCH transport system substrate-binding protein